MAGDGGSKPSPGPSGLDATMVAPEPEAGSPGTSSGTDDTVLAPAERSGGTDPTMRALSTRDSAFDDGARRSSLPTMAPPPERRYRLGAELGRGGMGRVVEAFDTHLGRTVALKEVLPRGGNIDRRFQREVRITARLEHASIVPLYDSGVMPDGRPFYVMRRVSGRPLDELIGRARPLEDRLALLPNVLAAIDAVAHAHRRGVIHRDLKPSNILVGELGETVVIDWGLAKVVGDDDEPIHDSLEPRVPSAADTLKTQIGSVFGTPGFMAPEQARGEELGPPGDVYALGATLYQLLAGRPPVAGTSATDVIASTMRHHIVPIRTAAPDSPPELVTIIEKALSFEADDRYANAGELAEDVRRFLTGQLVGAHQYTRRQRLVRFARRNRAPLIVAALAAVAVAVLSWVGVHRILRERDAATAASLEAREERRKADARAAELRERADQLLVQHARGLVMTDPTQAIAVLKQLDPRSAALAEARAVASAAVMRGVAYGLPILPDLTTSFEMSPDGRRLLQADRSGNMQILDLDARRVVSTFPSPGGTTAAWLGGTGRLLMMPSREPPFIYDPTSGAREPLATSSITAHSRTPGLELMALVDRDGRLFVYDVAAASLVQITAPPLRDVQLAQDGSWLAGERRDQAGLVILDRTGRVLAQRSGDVGPLASSSQGKLAVSIDRTVYEVDVRAQAPVFVPVPVDPADAKVVYSLLYRGGLLNLLTFQAVYVWDGKQVNRVMSDDGLVYGLVAAGDVLAMSAGDGRVHVHGRLISHALPLTSRPRSVPRIAATPRSTRIAALAGDAILVWDLASLLPRSTHPALATALFATESLLVDPAGITPGWQWWDLRTDTRMQRPLDGRLGMPMGVDVAAADGRVAVHLDRKGGAMETVIAYPDGTQERVVSDVAHGQLRLVDGDGVVFAASRGRVMGQVGDEGPRALVSLDGEVMSVAPFGRLGYAALSERGELVRGQFDGAGFSRARVDNLDRDAFVAGTPPGAVHVASGTRLLRWSTSLHEIARLPDRIVRIHTSAHGALVTLANDDAYYVPATGDQTPRRVILGASAVVSQDLTRVVSLDAASQLTILELPSRATWTVPKLYVASPRLTVSPSGRLVAQSVGAHTVVLQLPQPTSDFAAWLDGLTNAEQDDGNLTWSWRSAAP